MSRLNAGLGKQYGLIIPNNKGPKAKPALKNIFNVDDEPTPSVIQHMSSFESRTSKRAKVTQEAVLAQDPTAYSYDDVYDDLHDSSMSTKKSRRGDEEEDLNTDDPVALRAMRRIEVLDTVNTSFDHFCGSLA